MGSAAFLTAGTAANNLLQLDANGKAPAGVIPAIAINSLQKVAGRAARLALTDVEAYDLAKQEDNGITYMLSATPASVDANWIPSGDTAIDGAEIVSRTISLNRLGGGSPGAATYLRGDGQWVGLGGLATYSWQTVTANTTMAIDTAYFANGTTAGTPLVFTLPASAPVGSTIEIAGMGVKGWRIAQGSGQQIFFGNLQTTVGATGLIASTHQGDGIKIVGSIANTTRRVPAGGSQGNLEVG